MWKIIASVCMKQKMTHVIEDKRKYKVQKANGLRNQKRHMPFVSLLLLREMVVVSCFVWPASFVNVVRLAGRRMGRWLGWADRRVDRLAGRWVGGQAGRLTGWQVGRPKIRFRQLFNQYLYFLVLNTGFEVTCIKIIP